MMIIAELQALSIVIFFVPLATNDKTCLRKQI